MSHPPLDYREPSTPRERRPAGKWALLLVVWAIGLCIWAVYVVALFIAFLQLW